MRSTTLLAATCLALASVPVAAAEEIEVPPDAPFIHERTSIVFPPRLGDLHRRWVRDYGSAQYDVSAIYEAADGDTFLSFYVYRAGLPEASLWFDRLATIMAEREGFRPASHASLEPAAYRPAGSEAPIGLALAYDIAPGQPYTATGAILFPHGPWLIKLRATSSSKNADEIAQLLAETERSLGLPQPQYLSSPSYRVQPCAAQLDVGETNVLPPSPDVLSSSLMMLEVGESTDAEGTAIPPEGARWCRDDAVEDFYVYRPNDSPDRYVIAFGDSGDVLQVGIVIREMPDLLPTDLGIPIIYSDANDSALLALVDRLPDPVRAVEIAEQAAILGTSDRNGNVEITVSEPTE